MKTRTRCLICILALLLLTSCSAGPVDIEGINKEETYPDGPVCLAVIFHSLEEIYAYADLVVECTVTSSERVSVDGLPQTHSTVTIHSVFKGTPEGDTLLVGEELVVGPLSEGSHMVLFLVNSDLYDELFYIAGAFQGRFIEREGYYFQQATEDVKLTEEEYCPQTEAEFFSVLRSYQGAVTE